MTTSQSLNYQHSADEISVVDSQSALRTPNVCRCCSALKSGGSTWRASIALEHPLQWSVALLSSLISSLASALGTRCLSMVSINAFSTLVVAHCCQSGSFERIEQLTIGGVVSNAC